MADDIVSLEVGKEVVTPVIQKAIQAAIVANIGNADALISNAVRMALSVKIARDGSVSRYRSDNEHDFIEVMAANAIRKAAEEALKEWAAQNSEKVKEAVLKELNKPSRIRATANAFADAVKDSLDHVAWRPNVEIVFKPKRKE